MRIYQFHFYDAQGGRPLVDFDHCDDDGQATRVGIAQLNQHGTCLGVDVYDEERLVIRLERHADQIMAVGTGVHGAG